MEYENTQLEYHIDYINKRVHIKDHNTAHTYSIMNQISPTFQDWMINNEDLPKDILEFDWYLYSGNDIVARWKDYTFKFISADRPELYKSFLKHRAD